MEAIFRLSGHLWIGGEKSHPPKRRRERPAGISKLSRHVQLMTLCNMSEIPDGDEPSGSKVPAQSFYYLSSFLPDLAANTFNNIGYTNGSLTITIQRLFVSQLEFRGCCFKFSLLEQPQGFCYHTRPGIMIKRS